MALLEGLRRRYYAVRFGQEEADRLMQLPGVDREKRLALLERYGQAEVDKVIATRQWIEQREFAVRQITEKNRLGHIIQVLEARGVESLDGRSLDEFQSAYQAKCAEVEALKEAARKADDEFRERFGELDLAAASPLQFVPLPPEDGSK